MKSAVACTVLAVIQTAATPLRGQSDFLGEMIRLTQERDKALALVAAPVNKKYQTSLEDLLRRATKAGDLDAALKIRAALESLLAAKAAGIDPAQVKTKRALQKALVGTSWSLANSREDPTTIKFIITFVSETEVSFPDGKKEPWGVVDDRTIKLGQATLVFDASLQTYLCADWYGSGIRQGVRKERPRQFVRRSLSL